MSSGRVVSLASRVASRSARSRRFTDRSEFLYSSIKTDNIQFLSSIYIHVGH